MRIPAEGEGMAKQVRAFRCRATGRYEPSANLGAQLSTVHTALGTSYLWVPVGSGFISRGWAFRMMALASALALAQTTCSDR